MSLFWLLDSQKYHLQVLSDKYAPSSTLFDSLNYTKHIALNYHRIWINGGCIEPFTGWFIYNRTIVAESYSYWPNAATGWPPLPSLIKYLNPCKKILIIDKAISFHYGWNNYYHFFIDTLPQIKYWKEHGDANLTWIVPEKVKHIPFVQQYLAIDDVFSGVKVHYQKRDEYIKVKKEVHFIKRSRFGSLELRQIINNLLVKIVPTQLQSSDNKVLLIRRGHRNISNLAELIAIALLHGFSIIETDEMSLMEQVQLFSNTRYLVGIHGAGLTNMIFRSNQKMSVLEIFPRNKIPIHYWHLTIDFNYQYSYVIGEDYNDNQETFLVDSEQFKLALNRMLKEDPNLSL